MNLILNAYWQLCRFRLGPQDMPASGVLLAVTCVMYVLLGGLGLIGFTSYENAFLSTLVDAGIIAGLTRMALWAKGLDIRFTQTITALLGAGIIFSVMSMPLMVWQLQYEEPAQALMPSLLMTCIFVWNLAVIGHILRHALNTQFFIGLFISIFYMYVSTKVIQTLFINSAQ